MLPTLGRGNRVGRWGEIIFSAAIAIAASSAGAATLFPEPLHLVRRVSDPITRATTTIDEYCQGNRIVSTSGARAITVDYEKQTVTEVDRTAGTYSITSFDDIARANAALRPAKATTEKAADWSATRLRANAWRFAAKSGTTIDVAVDPTVKISREALDALIGAAYPNRRTPEHDALTRAAGGGIDRVQAESSSSRAQPSFALPLDETITWDVEDSRITMKNAIVRVSKDVAPPDVLMIPPGAKRVESARTALPRMIDELDRLPSAPSRP